MLRIDETSKTLVAPQEGGFVPEAPPAREELLHLLASGWQAFAAEIGQKNVTYLGHTLEPGVDMLAMDRSGGRIVVVLVGDSGRELIGRAMLAGAVVTNWSAEELTASNKELSAVIPGESPRIILVAPEWDDPAVATIDWLSRKHHLDLQAYKVGAMRFGAEKLLTLDPALPAADQPAAPADQAAEFFAHVAQQQAEPDAEDASSTPPPPVAAS